MRVRKHIPTQVNKQAPDLAAYHQGPILTNGALEFIYNKPTTYPLQALNGSGVFTQSQMNVIPLVAQARVDVALTHQTIYGAGSPASGVEFQSLVEGGGYVEN